MSLKANDGSERARENKCNSLMIWELKGDTEDGKGSLSHENKEEI